MKKIFEMSAGSRQRNARLHGARGADEGKDREREGWG
jgi:hypothetical protein